MEKEKYLFLEEKWRELKDTWEWKSRRESNHTFFFSFSGEKCIVHNPDLFSMLEIEGTHEFMKDYKIGFEVGKDALKNEEEITLADLRNKNSREETINQLRYILYKRNFTNNSKGLLSKVRFSTPLIWSSKAMYEQGYCNGFMHSINKLIDKAGMSLEDFAVQDNTLGMEDQPLKLDAIHYALAYILEATAMGEAIPFGKKTQLEAIPAKKGWNCGGNTFYKKINDLQKIDVDKNKDLLNIDQEWKEKVLSIATNPQTLNEYLKTKGL